MSDLLKKIEYALRKDSLSDAERIASARQLVSQGLSDHAPQAPSSDTKAEASRRYPAPEDSIYDEDDNQASRLFASQRAAFISGVEWRASCSINHEIADEIYRAMETLGAKIDLLSIVGSYGDTMSDADTLAMLRDWNAAPPARSAASTVEPVADPLHGLDERLDRLFVSNECGDGFVLSARSASNIVGIVREWIRAKSAAPTTSPEPADVKQQALDWCKANIVSAADPSKPADCTVPCNACMTMAHGCSDQPPEPDAVRDLAGVLAAELAPKFDAFLKNPGNPHLAADLRQWFWDNKSGVLAALSRPAHGGWEDISTAPTDGTPIEGCYHDDPEADALPVTSAFWSRISECWYSDIAGKPVKLTHWRPLSRRPALARNQGQGGGPRS